MKRKSIGLFFLLGVLFMPIIAKAFTEEDFDEAYAVIAPTGEVTIATVEPGELTKMMGLEFLNDFLTIPDGFKVSIDPALPTGYTIRISDPDDESSGKSFPITINFKERIKTYEGIVADIKTSLEEMAADFQSDFTKRFIVEDLDSINYWYSVQELDEDTALASVTNFSSRLHEFAGNLNIDFIYRPGMGGDASNFIENVVGMVDILYNGDIYDSVDPIGFNLVNVIYVPSDTEKSEAAFKAAALKRINEYLKNIDVSITAGGPLSDLNEHQNKWIKVVTSPSYAEEEIELFPSTKMCDKWFKIKIGENTYDYFIVADSDKMKTPFLKTKDPNTNIYITTDSFDVPLDSSIRVEKLDENSDEYKKLSKKINIIKGMAYDLNLFSISNDMYIKKTIDGKYKVYIPVDEATTKKKLTAVYMKEDGTLENHTITFEGNYAVFETDHFSTYAIAEVKNPKTGDIIVLYLLILTASGYILLKTRKFN